MARRHEELETVDLEAGASNPLTRSKPMRNDEAQGYGMAHPFDSTSDCFDDFDGKAVIEPEDVKQRRLSGQSYFRDQLRAFDSRAVFYSSIFLFEWLLFLVFPPLFVAFTVVVVMEFTIF